MNSDMSTRTSASSVSKRNSASALVSSVLPTPVGPRNRNDPFGRFGSDRPARERRIASATAVSASPWPTTRLPSASSMRSSLSFSPSSILLTGMPVHLETISAISSSVTLFLSRRVSPVSWPRRRQPASSRAPGIFPYWSSDMRARSWPRRAASRSMARALQLFLDRGLALHGGLLGLPDLVQVRVLPLQRLELGLQVREPLLRRVVGLLLQGHLLDLELDDAAVEPVHLLGLGVDLHAQAGRGLVDEVDGLVGQLPVGDVAVGQRRRGHDGRVGDVHAVMDLVALLQATEDRDGVLHQRLQHHAPSGSGAPGPRPSRCTCGTRRAWWRPRSAVRRGRARASACCPRPWSPRPCRRRPWCAARR